MVAPAPTSRECQCLPRPEGFTLVEMVIVLLIVAMLSVIAAPSLASIIVAQRLRAAGSDLTSSLYLARSEAIKRNVNVTVRPLSGEEWNGGWEVTTAGGEQLDRRHVPGPRVRVTQAPDAIVYTSSGRLEPLGGARVEFSDEEEQPGITPRCVIVDTAGVPRLEARSCA